MATVYVYVWSGPNRDVLPNTVNHTLLTTRIHIAINHVAISIGVAYEDMMSVPLLR